jgi:hypothetical protein
MSDTHLPDDVHRWPDDPFEVLGVKHPLDLRAVRRAYAQLIRVYKPEHAPEEFRRIRDAYEVLQMHARWAAYESDDAPPPEDAQPSYDAGQPDPAAASPSQLDELQDLWQEACRGDPVVAYRRLAELVARQPDREELYARLYWLLVLDPQLDVQRGPCAWLFAGIRQTGLRGRLLELYAAAIEDDPEEALSPRCAKLLACPSPGDRVVDFAVRRWRVLGGQARWGAIAADLKALRTYLHDDPRGWACLLLAAVDQLAWAESPEVRGFVEDCRREAERAAGDDFALHSSLGRCDFLVELASGLRSYIGSWGITPEGAAALRGLLCAGWNWPSDAVRPQLLAFLAPLVQDPARGLIVLDRLRTRVPLAFHQLCAVIDAAMYPPCARPDDAELGRALADVRGWSQAKNYEELRPQVLAFCVAHAMSVEDFIAFLSRATHVGRAAHLAQRLGEDPALSYLCKASRSF